MAPFAVGPDAQAVLDRLWSAGHAAYVVGGAVRDALLGRVGHDWDVATDARPDRLLSLFPGSHSGNRFGTVRVGDVDVTTFRRDHRYADHRRPEEVTFTDSVDEDLARRDFTVNAIAWGRGPDGGPAGFRDPTGGIEDLHAGRLRAVGDPAARFDEDALRLLRAARIAAAAGLEIEAGTRAAMRRHAGDARWLSGERVGIELRRLLAGEKPTTALRTLADTGILAVIIPELVAQRGVPQAKIPGHDLWDHALATLEAAATALEADAAPLEAAAAMHPRHDRLLLAALLHDIGKPATFADGHFIGHAEAGAELAGSVLARLRQPTHETSLIVRLIREHMFQYSPAWTDAAVRRFLRRVGADLVDDLLRLRQADNVGSGQEPDADGLAELRARLDAQRAAHPPLTLADLAIDGRDLLSELGLAQGPQVGALLERLLESVVNDPARNERGMLLADARSWTEGQRAIT